MRPYILQLLFRNRVQEQPDCDTIPESRVNATTSSNWLLILELHISGRSYINYRNSCIIIPGELQLADSLHAMSARAEAPLCVLIGAQKIPNEALCLALSPMCKRMALTRTDIFGRYHGPVSIRKSIGQLLAQEIGGEYFRDLKEPNNQPDLQRNRK